MNSSEGYVIVAKNLDSTDYVTCARVLAKSIRLTGDTRPITLITNSTDDVELEIFDSVEFLKSDESNQLGKFNDDWQVYDLSPYDKTFKIESDVIVTRNLDSWWETCQERDLVVATGTRNYLQQLATSRYYRQTLDKNYLPDVYNGITYFRKSLLSKEFFKLVKTIFNNWTDINNNLHASSPLIEPDTDTVYAIACSIFGLENTIFPTNVIQWIHMKSKINGTVETWTDELNWELVGSDFRINTISQLYPVHYYVKELALQLEPIYDKQLTKR
jgi:hypothetical protein